MHWIPCVRSTTIRHTRYTDSLHDVGNPYSPASLARMLTTNLVQTTHMPSISVHASTPSVPLRKIAVTVPTPGKPFGAARRHCSDTSLNRFGLPSGGIGARDLSSELQIRARRVGRGRGALLRPRCPTRPRTPESEQRPGKHTQAGRGGGQRAVWWRAPGRWELGGNRVGSTRITSRASWGEEGRRGGVRALLRLCWGRSCRCGSRCGCGCGWGCGCGCGVTSCDLCLAKASASK